MIAPLVIFYRVHIYYIIDKYPKKIHRKKNNRLRKRLPQALFEVQRLSFGIQLSLSQS